ncbi:MAG: SDR family NAD(P)-dependent oxidoreductase [Kangiellaceae bacterium]|nr:SDR family NAD(P)-dependent oxidoreductase [Kangiellaceae bacterium]
MRIKISPGGKSATKHDLVGKTILITGCNSGIGLKTMRELAVRGARVLAVARKKDSAEKACQEIGGLAYPFEGDHSDPNSIKKLIAQIDEPIDVLIANAGVMAVPNKILIQGIESHFFINHLAHAIIIQGVKHLLTEKGRVVILSSAAHSFVKGDGLILDDLAWHRPYKPMSAYAHSKLANLQYTFQLAKTLKPNQSVNALHPGVIDTPLFRHMIENKYSKKDVSFGAENVIGLAVDEKWDDKTGEYISANKIGKPSTLALNESKAKKLWEVTQYIIDSLG